MLDKGYQLSLDLVRLEVTEIDRESLLCKLQETQVVLKVRILEAFSDQLEEHFDGELRWQVRPVDLAIHGVTPPRIQVVQLLFNLLNGSGSRRPCL